MNRLLLCVLGLSLSSNAFSAANGWTPKYQKKEKLKTIKLEPRVENLKRKKVTTNKPKSSKTVLKKPVPEKIKTHPLFKLYKKNYKAKAGLINLKQKTIALKQEAVPVLTYVMKTDGFPDNNRWVATFMLGRIMGVKSAPFISKFAFHPNFMLRLASLKTLLALGQKKFKGIYARLLKDKAMIVRIQALENIKEMKIKELAPYVWAMLYDKKNYISSEGTRKRGNIIKNIIKTMGDLDFKKARKPMLTMMQKKKYRDIYEELDYALSKISPEPSPNGNLSVKKHYWSQVAVSETTI